MSTWLSDHFHSTDFDCKCKSPKCIWTSIDELLVESLEVLWALSGEFKINSGFRCPTHNAEVGGKKDSQHLLGRAADVESTRGYNGAAMARYVDRVNPFHNGGIGIYDKFCHADVRGESARWRG